MNPTPSTIAMTWVHLRRRAARLIRGDRSDGSTTTGAPTDQGIRARSAGSRAPVACRSAVAARLPAGALEVRDEQEPAHGEQRGGHEEHGPVEPVGEPAAVRRQDRPPLRDTHLDTLLKPYRVQADLLVTMPVVSQIVAQVLIAEIGVESM